MSTIREPRTESGISTVVLLMMMMFDDVIMLSALLTAALSPNVDSYVFVKIVNDVAGIVIEEESGDAGYECFCFALESFLPVHNNQIH